MMCPNIGWYFATLKRLMNFIGRKYFWVISRGSKDPSCSWGGNQALTPFTLQSLAILNCFRALSKLNRCDTCYYFLYMFCQISNSLSIAATCPVEITYPDGYELILIKIECSWWRESCLWKLYVNTLGVGESRCIEMSLSFKCLRVVSLWGGADRGMRAIDQILAHTMEIVC